MNLEKELIIKLNNNFKLDKESYQSLRMLYKPLVSTSAINIYLSIYELALKKSHITSLLLRDVISSNITLEKIILKLEQLKEYKLIKYTSNEIELYPPLNPIEFNEVGLLNYLKKYCSKDQYNFTIESLYNEDIEIIKKESFDVSKLKYKSTKKKALPFDYDEFIKHIDDSVYLKPYKEKIESLSTLYDYSLNDMLRLVYEIDLNGENDIDKLISKAFEKFSTKNKSTLKQDESELEFINYFKNKKAEEIMLNVKDISKPRKADQEIIRKLRDELKLNEDIISLLVCYSIVTNENKLHPFVFYETIINDWNNNNINTVEEAFNYINKLYKEYKKKSKITEVKDDWFDDLIKKYREEKEC